MYSVRLVTKEAGQMSVRAEIEREVAAERGITEEQAARECADEVTRRVYVRAAQLPVRIPGEVQS
jgi:hypothetical protein